MPPRSGHGRTARVGRLARLTALAIALSVALPATVLAMIPPVSPTRAPALDPPARPADPARPAASASPFTLDLATTGDFVGQTNFVQCVGASMQMMLNMIRPTNDRTAATQLDLQTLARDLSGERPDGRVRKGASVIGWTAGLNALGAGPYRTTGEADLQAVLRLAATAMRTTNRPVGLLVWKGRHAWVMAGFTATADPAVTSDFEVTRVIVLDPLYPHGSTVWGPSPKPRQSLTIAQLARQFVPRGSRPSSSTDGVTDGPTSAWSRALAGRYVIVVPVPSAPPHQVPPDLVI